jgi:hypothetical protein
MHSYLQEHLSKPGGGAPLRTDSGNPIGVVRVHPDIRNQREHLNEEAKKKNVANGVRKTSNDGESTVIQDYGLQKSRLRFSPGLELM